MGSAFYEKPRKTEIQLVCGKWAFRDRILSFIIEQDLDQPDMCLLTLDNKEGETTGPWEGNYNEKRSPSNLIDLGDELTLSVGADPAAATPVFHGEIVGFETVYKSDGGSLCIIRAFNQLHRLLRGRKSRTFKDTKDSLVFKEIAKENGLDPSGIEDTTEVHPHIYQHNQTDLEFLRVRADRIGYSLYTERAKDAKQDTLVFAKSVVRESADKKMGLLEWTEDTDVTMDRFTTRLSSAGIVQKVEVRAWNPEKKIEIVSVKEPPAKSDFGDAMVLGTTMAKPLGNATVSYTVDHPVATQTQADDLAQARLVGLSGSMMGFVKAVAFCNEESTEPKVLAELKAGLMVHVTVDRKKTDPSNRVNGNYKVIGASHRYEPQGGGYNVEVRMCRDAVTEYPK